MGSGPGDEYIQLKNDGGVVIATIQGGNFQEERRILATLKKLGEVIDAHENVQLVLDMASVEYLSSAGLGRLVALLKKATNGGGSMYIAGLRPEIEELFEVMRLSQIFKLFPTPDDARDAFQAEMTT